jgi:hypothetical protein
MTYVTSLSYSPLWAVLYDCDLAWSRGQICEHPESTSLILPIPQNSKLSLPLAPPVVMYLRPNRLEPSTGRLSWSILLSLAGSPTGFIIKCCNIYWTLMMKHGYSATYIAHTYDLQISSVKLCSRTLIIWCVQIFSTISSYWLLLHEIWCV